MFGFCFSFIFLLFCVWFFFVYKCNENKKCNEKQSNVMIFFQCFSLHFSFSCIFTNGMKGVFTVYYNEFVMHLWVYLLVSLLVYDDAMKEIAGIFVGVFTVYYIHYHTNNTHVNASQQYHNTPWIHYYINNSTSDYTIMHQYICSAVW